MSIKTVIQFLIILLIIAIIGLVYFKYFETKKSVVEEISLSEKKRDEQLEKLETQIQDLLKKNNELNKKIEDTQKKSLEKNKPITNQEVQITKIEEKDVIKKNELSSEQKETNNNKIKIDEKDVIKENDLSSQQKETNNNKIKIEKKKIKNFVKNVEYTSVDQRGNRFYLLAKSGKSNIDNNDILDLNDVRGEIKSEKRDTIYIISDYAQYNAVNLNSKFYKKVKINYQDKEITCENFDIIMETNKAIAYNNVVITDPQSIMKAGIIEFDLKTKNININPESTTTEIEVIKN